MKYTGNYNLKKPEGSDVVNIDDLNDNADIIDQKLKEVENKADSAETPEGAQEKADAAEQNAKEYTDQKVGTVSQVVDAHLADIDYKTNFISVKQYESLKVSIAQGYDWSPAISQAIEDAKITKKKIILHADEDMYITQPIIPDVTTKIVGFGKFNSVIRPIGAIKAIDLSGAEAKIGVEISSVAIVGDKSVGQIGIDANYLVNGSSIKDVSIENCDVGIRISKCWYSAFSDIFMRGNETYGLHVISASSTEQVNAISFKSIFIQGGVNCVFLDGINVAAGIKFDSCTFEKSKKTAVVSDGFAPLKFDNCYFESNYSHGETTDTLTWDKPIDVKVIGRGNRNQVKFDSCYFARKNDFLASSQKTGVYIGSNVKPTFENCTFVCNTSNYLDSQIYSDSQYPASIRNCSEDGYAKELYKGIQKDSFLAFDSEFNLRYTSTLSMNALTDRSGNYYVRFIPNTDGTVAETVTLRLQRISDSSQLGEEVSFPKTFTKNTPIDLKIGYVQKDIPVKLVAYTSTSTDLIGVIALIRKHNN